jgi:hypothetical protein
MTVNMGPMDKGIRVGIAAGIAIAYFFGIISGTAATVMIVLAIIFVLTSLVSFCPLYTLLGINTCKLKK